MNATITQSIEALDFDFEIPCEHSQHKAGRFGHAGPAYYYIRLSVLPCGCEEGQWPSHLYICKSGYEDTTPITCLRCMKSYPKHLAWTIIGKVGY